MSLVKFLERAEHEKYQDFEDEARVRRRIAVGVGEHGKQGVEHVLQELDELFAPEPHHEAERVGYPLRVRAPLEQRQQVRCSLK